MIFARIIIAIFTVAGFTTGAANGLESSIRGEKSRRTLTGKGNGGKAKSTISRFQDKDLGKPCDQYDGRAAGLCKEYCEEGCKMMNAVEHDDGYDVVGNSTKSSKSKKSKKSGKKQSGAKQSGHKQAGNGGLGKTRMLDGNSTKSSKSKKSGNEQSGNKQAGKKQSGNKQAGNAGQGKTRMLDGNSTKSSKPKKSGKKQSGNKQAGKKQSGNKQAGNTGQGKTRMLEEGKQSGESCAHIKSEFQSITGEDLPCERCPCWTKLALMEAFPDPNRVASGSCIDNFPGEETSQIYLSENVDNGIFALAQDDAAGLFGNGTHYCLNMAGEPMSIDEKSAQMCVETLANHCEIIGMPVEENNLPPV